MRVAGIDPGTGSMDILAIDDEGPSLLYEEAVPRPRVTRDPRVILEIVDMLVDDYGVEAIALPSGYGAPPRPGDPEAAIREATFVNKQDMERSLQIHGLRRVMLELYRRGDVETFFTPGVVQLPKVPRWRKANRIDMGTADKVFSVAAALWTEAELHGVPPASARFILVEAGKAYTAAIAVDGGVIVDGVGGTSGFTGFLGLGGMDAELAYVLAEVEPGFSRQRLFQGGAATMAGVAEPGELALKLQAGDPRAVEAFNALAEGVVKSVAALLPSLSGPPERIYLSGRITRDPVLGPMIEERLKSFLDILGLKAGLARPSRIGSETKEAATGAALLASGYAGGRYKWLVEALRLWEAEGSIFDHILLPGVREAALRAFRG